ncbi:methyltransferase family protein [Antarcticirhabdus aurantiaca]|uniref:Isoprenylcysteine carboxylmethyltransferase family protein n=1 Tax=Antarcticirhabdus aurantiaca TaxID=2606717 RepID=A0ACD4NII2_9HYPH|nr:isoprenylcysteine carboxylmethyltransferase family protein [Antarcticirhabdus aurantiaca]WAJ26638.1 isoprenylcysteine carboxylmethyltransferase family protein [Jeongeuplla avenae]
MSAAVEDVLRFGPAIVLAVAVAWLVLATRRTSREIGGRAHGFGRSLRQRLARVLFGASIAGAALALGLHAAGSTSRLFEPLAGEASAVRLAGLALAVGGQVLTLAARGSMGRRWRVGVPEKAPDHLVTTGLFGLSRNPVFLGMLAMAAGLAVAVPCLAVVACALAFWIACEVQVRDEERLLERSFGPAYAAYRSAVRRWI